MEDGESLLVLNSLLFKMSVITYDESIAINRQLSIVVVRTFFRFIVVSSSITPKLLYFLAKMHFHRCNAFLQALLGETYRNSPKTCNSDKKLILLQKFTGATYKLKNRGVGVPSSYLNNCIRLGVVTLLS